ncbi:MAG: hypothetical protein K0U93_27455 [Gammaproteobacteria bacterium]|nr:hypothetical protein [Gammaproteobacteria bacterium]
MPNNLKVLVSALALAAALGMFWFDTSVGTPGASRWVALFLGPFVVFAIWVFPEASSKDIRKEAAERRKP